MTALYALLGVAVGFVVGRFRTLRANGFQNGGEALVSETLRKTFGAPNYYLMNHITLQVQEGTTQIDHILVSRFGIFVIETKAYKGWIFANARDEEWTQVLFKAKFRFQNPLIQNRRHVQAVHARLDFLPPETIKSVVVFVGEAEFQTEMPSGVFYLQGLVDHIREQATPIMSLNRMQFCVGRLETTRLEISGKTDVQHIQSLQRWHGTSRH